MLNFKIVQLNLEQQALIPVYRKKWQEIALANEKIDRNLATQAINAAYEFLDLSKPDIMFFSTPYAALENIYNQVKNGRGTIKDTSLGNPLANSLLNKLFGNTITQIKEEILEQLQGNLDNGLAASIASETAIKLQESKLISLAWAHAGSLMVESFQNSELDDMTKNAATNLLKLFVKFGFASNAYIAPFMWQAFYKFADFILGKQSQSKNDSLSTIGTVFFTGEFNNKVPLKYQLPTIEMSAAIANVLVPEIMADHGYYIDYFHEVLNCERDEIKWDIFYVLVTNRGWIFPYEKVAIICDRH